MFNNIFKIFIIAFLFIYSSACDYLDVVPDNVATMDNAFSDRYNAEKFLATCYSYMPVFGDVWTDPTIFGGDECWMNEDITQAGSYIGKGFQNSNNPYINFWDGSNGASSNMYTALRDCNIFLEEISSVEGMSAREKSRWIAEVKFLKAYYHFWLVKFYGPIPVIRENLPISVNTEDVKVYRDPVDEVFEYIVSLIDEAIPYLPLRVNSETTELGRITQPIAAAMKARILVTAASPLFNGNAEVASLKDNRGIQLFNPSYEPEKWEKAAEAALEAIDICESTTILLFEEYETFHEHSDAVLKELTLRSIVTTKRSSEVIWSATRSPVTGYYQGRMQPMLVPFQGGSPVEKLHGATLRMAELFYSKNGVPIEEDISYDYQNRYALRTATSEDNDFVRSGEQTAKLHYDREPRFYASISFDRGTFVLDPTYYYVQARANEIAGKLDFERAKFSATGYWPKKFISPLNSFVENTGGYVSDYDFPFPIIRLADLYLLYAEALNEVKSSPDNEVYEYIDKIRERAGLKGVVESWQEFSSRPDKPLTKEGMREIIRQERMIELAFEGQRFWGLRRWKLASEYMSRPIQGWNINADYPELYYDVTTIYVPRFGFKDYFWPVREEERIKNPNLVQNLGW
jgi:starch-binding outer membrane protein, SusD/RagB family